MPPDKKSRSNDDDDDGHVIAKIKSVSNFPERSDQIRSPLKSWNVLETLTSVLRQNPVELETQRNFDVSTVEREKKSTGNYVIEMAVFVDRYLYEKMKEVFIVNHEQQIVDMVMAMISSVSFSFKVTSLLFLSLSLLLSPSLHFSLSF